MHKFFVYAAYGWLSIAAVMHFAIDVVSQHLRGKHPPGPATTLYDGFHSAFAFGQLLFGLLGLWLAVRAMALVSSAPVIALSLVAAGGWFTIAALFMPYWQPRFSLAVFAVLIVVGAVLGRR
jgi:hypothetical protein